MNQKGATQELEVTAAIKVHQCADYGKAGDGAKGNLLDEKRIRPLLLNEGEKTVYGLENDRDKKIACRF